MTGQHQHRLLGVRFAAGRLAWCVGVAAVIVGPMARKGWVLSLDWVTGPRLDWWSAVGSGASLPAGPLFHLTAAVCASLSGAASGWIVPFVTLVLAGLAGARIGELTALGTVGAPRRDGRGGVPGPGVLAGATAAMWNPFIHERLYAGQIAVLAGYACTLHLAASVMSPRAGQRKAGVEQAAWWIAAIACSVHFAPIGALVVVGGVVTRWRRGWSRDHIRAGVRELAAIGGATAVVSAGWLLPMLATAVPAGDNRTAKAFSTRPDEALGLLGGTAVQRGFWRGVHAAPSTVLGGWWPFVAGLLAAGAVLGLARIWRSGQRNVAVLAACLGVIGWLGGQGSNGPLGAGFTALLALPGGRVLREPAKLLTLVTVPWIVGLASLVSSTQTQMRGAVRHLAWGLALAPALLTPGLVWGVSGRLSAVAYPTTWWKFRARMESSVPPSGPSTTVGDRLVVVPFARYLDPGFTGGRVIRNPAPAFFGGRVVDSDDPKVPGLAGSKQTVELESALRTVDPRAEFRRRGIGWVLVVDAESSGFTGSGLEVVAADGTWTLLRVPDA